MILGVDTDEVLDNPVDALKETKLQLGLVIPFIDAVTLGADVEELESLTADDLQTVGDEVAANFFLSAYRQHCERRINDTIDSLRRQGVLTGEESESRSNATLAPERSRSTKQCSTLRFQRS